MRHVTRRGSNVMSVNSPAKRPVNSTVKTAKTGGAGQPSKTGNIAQQGYNAGPAVLSGQGQPAKTSGTNAIKRAVAMSRIGKGKRT